MSHFGLPWIAWAALATGLGACGSGGQGRERGAEESATAPQRVLPTNATAVDFVVDLVGPGRIVAVPDTVADYATVELDLGQWAGDRVFSEFTAEVLLALDPDLVVVSPWQDQSAINRLTESGIEVLELPPVSELADVRTSITMAGAALHAEARATELLEDFDQRVSALDRATQARGEVGGLVYTNYGSGGWAAGRGTTAHLLMTLAGVSNVAADAGRVGHDGVDIETLLDLDPDILVISKPSRDYGATRVYLDGEPALAGLGAIAEGRIVELPSGLFSTASHHMLDAAEELARQVDLLVAKGSLVPGAD
jgi:iron complex transport system substrate-binding protein